MHLVDSRIIYRKEDKEMKENNAKGENRTGWQNRNKQSNPEIMTKAIMKTRENCRKLFHEKGFLAAFERPAGFYGVVATDEGSRPIKAMIDSIAGVFTIEISLGIHVDQSCLAVIYDYIGKLNGTLKYGCFKVNPIGDVSFHMETICMDKSVSRNTLRSIVSMGIQKCSESRKTIDKLSHTKIQMKEEIEDFDDDLPFR